ncbi:hypothetical protein GJAV_G00178330 [Gymnothorax javanicus]|nr:hypothetical protein GJAV_G00178330 [Gymnothorax javanicus]
MLSQERSPTPSPSPSPSCREDADGVDDSPVLLSKPAALEDAQSTAAPTAEAIAAEPEDAPPPLVTTPSTSDSLDHEESSDRGEAGAPGLAKVWGVAEVDGELMESMERRPEADPDGPPPPRQDLALREPPEGQQGRGVADGQAYAANAPDPAPSPMEVAPPIALPTTVNASCPAPALPDEDSCIPPHVPRPLPSSPVPCQSSASPPPSLPSDHRFPTAHIQKIQAAGFSASEAAEALEQVQGHVELALLMLLARKITVPT